MFHRHALLRSAGTDCWRRNAVPARNLRRADRVWSYRRRTGPAWLQCCHASRRCLSGSDICRAKWNPI